MRFRSTIPLLAALATLGSSPPAARDACTLEYQRADNMWSAAGNLGWESVTVPVGQHKVFITDLAYEKRRNDGVRYYGSHLRLATNRGTRRLRLHLVAQTSWERIDLLPGMYRSVNKDLSGVQCE